MACLIRTKIEATRVSSLSDAETLKLSQVSAIVRSETHGGALGRGIFITAIGQRIYVLSVADVEEEPNIGWFLSRQAPRRDRRYKSEGSWRWKGVAYGARESTCGQETKPRQRRCEMEWLDVADKYWNTAFLVCFEQHHDPRGRNRTDV